MKTGLESLDTGASKITYSGNEGPKAPQQMAMADPLLVEEYQKYVFDMEEQGLQPMSFEEFRRQAMSGMAEGGIANTKTIKGQPHMLAYITPSEAGTLKDLGGQETMTPEGIPAYPPPGEYGGPGYAGSRSPDTNRERGIRAAQSYSAPSPSPDRSFTPRGGGSDPIPDSSGSHSNQTLVDMVEAEQKKTDILNEIRRLEEEKKDPPIDRRTGLEKVIDFAQQFSPVAQLASMFGPLDNKAFFTEKVLKSKNPQGYDEDDYEKYMTARMAGLIDAYGNPISGGRGDSQGIMSQYPTNMAMAPATGTPEIEPIVTPPVQTANPFLPGSSLPFSTYGTAAHGAQFGVDPRMFAADGGRIGYADAGSVKNVDQVREAILKGIRDGIFTFNDLTQYDETGVLPKEEDSISSRYNRAINLIKPFEGKEIREPFYPDRFKGEEIREPFYPNRFENLKPELMAQGGRIGYAGGDYVGSKHNVTLKDEYDSYLKEGGTMSFSSFVEMMREDRAQGGRIGYAGGGIADLRQGYFLGKLVKKATRAVKKIIKSPVGKAALLAAPFMFGPGKTFASSLFGSKLSPGALGGKTPGIMAMFKRGLGFAKENPFTTIAGFSSLPLIFGSSEEEDEQNYYADAKNIFDTVGSPDELRRRALAGTLPQNEFPFQQYYAADGGRVGLMGGGDLRTAALNQLYGINDEEDKKLSKGGSAGLPPITQGVEGEASQSFSDDETPMPTETNQMPRPMPNPMMMANRMNPMMMRGMNPMMMRGMNPMMRGMNPMMARGMMPRMMAQEGGLMDMGGMEKDYRNEGGFVPIGGQERADDVPARLSKNEFVFTADAVRNAGDGDIDKGAEIMENMMENLEKGGKVSEESQGLEGARDMFATAQRLEGVL